MFDPTKSENERLIAKWKPLLEHKSLPEIGDYHRKAVTARLLENQEQENKKRGNASLLTEGAPTNQTANVAGYDPVLISMIRRSMPNLIAYDVCGVQPLQQPTGLIFSLRAKYGTDIAAGEEAFYNEADSAFSGTGTQAGTDPTDDGTLTAGGTMATADGEVLGSGESGDGAFGEMSLDIDRVNVTVGTRALKAEYSIELAQDLKSLHGLDAETELANILSNEILSEINREIIRKIYLISTVSNTPVFDMNVDAKGRWQGEQFKGLFFQLEKENNQIAKDTRRGKGNIVICSSNVASALMMAGVLDTNTTLNAKLNVDDTGNTYAGSIGGRIKVYIDPYAAIDYIVTGFKGSNAYDAGMFYCPYVPLQMVRAVDPGTFQPKIGFKTRYGLVHNPFGMAEVSGQPGNTDLFDGTAASKNYYYRKFKITNL